MLHCLLTLPTSKNLHERGQIFAAQTIVAEHAARLAFRMSQNKLMFDRTESVFYWRSRHGREVDVVFPIRDDRLAAIEVKYQSGIRGDDLHGLFDLRKATGTGGGIVVTRRDLGTRSGAALVPATLFLLLA